MDEGERQQNRDGTLPVANGKHNEGFELNGVDSKL